MKTIEAGSLVSMNNLPTGTVFKVKKVDGCDVWLTVANGPKNQALQWADKSMCRKPTKAQLTHNGI